MWERLYFYLNKFLYNLIHLQGDGDWLDDRQMTLVPSLSSLFLPNNKSPIILIKYVSHPYAKVQTSDICESLSTFLSEKDPLVPHLENYLHH